MMGLNGERLSPSRNLTDVGKKKKKKVLFPKEMGESISFSQLPSHGEGNVCKRQSWKQKQTSLV